MNTELCITECIEACLLEGLDYFECIDWCHSECLDDEYLDLDNEYNADLT